MVPCGVLAADNSAGSSSIINGAPCGFATGGAASTATAADNSASVSSVINGVPCGFAAGRAASISTVLQALRGLVPGEMSWPVGETTAVTAGETTALPACCATGGLYGYANHSGVEVAGPPMAVPGHMHEGGNDRCIRRRDDTEDGVGSCETRRGDKGLPDAGSSCASVGIFNLSE